MKLGVFLVVTGLVLIWSNTGESLWDGLSVIPLIWGVVRIIRWVRRRKA